VEASVFLQPGHFIILPDGGYSYLLVPVIGHGNSLSHVVLRCVMVTESLHPDVRLPWLSSGETLSAVSVNAIGRRVRFVRQHSNTHRPEGDTSGHFLVINGLFYAKHKASLRPVYSFCPKAECAGRTLKPTSLGAIAQCPKCDAHFRLI
jgi:hypothetical protein